MNKTYIAIGLLLFILFVGTFSIAKNIVKPNVIIVEHNNTIIREILPQCNATQIILVNNTILDKTCQSKLNNCNFQQNKYFGLYQECLAENNSMIVQNLTLLLNEKDKQLSNYSSIIKNISVFFKGG
jgi:hypothetical protein